MEFWSRRETCENRGSQPIAAKPWRDYGQPQDRQNEDQKEHILRRVSRTDRFLMRKRDLAPEAETAGRQASGSFKLRPAELQNQVGTHPTACCDSSNKQERRTVGNIWTLRSVALYCTCAYDMAEMSLQKYQHIISNSNSPAGSELRASLG
jgi:hypothetical protein